MKKLTKEDLQIIGMYLAFGELRFEPENCQSILESVTGKSLLDNDKLIIGYVAEDDEITHSARLLHPKNDIYPVLYRIEEMTQIPTDISEEFAKARKTLHDIEKIEDKVKYFPQMAFAATIPFKYRFDIFGLINQGKAIDYKKSKWYKAMEQKN
jgi:hypothetical protein